MSRLPPEVDRRLDERAEPEDRAILRAFLDAMLSLGCIPVVPDAQLDRHLNVEPPPGHVRGRICSITVGTARVEFQADSYEVARRMALSDHFDHLGGNKAAVTLRSRADVDLAMDLARPYLETRRERGT